MTPSKEIMSLWTLQLLLDLIRAGCELVSQEKEVLPKLVKLFGQVRNHDNTQTSFVRAETCLYLGREVFTSLEVGIGDLDWSGHCG
jgi:hypothetical protein